MKLNRAQLTTLLALYDRDRRIAPNFLAFRRTVFPLIFEPQVAMIPYHNMIIGIEEDGHAHS